MQMNQMNQLPKSVLRGQQVKPKKKSNVTIELWTNTQETTEYAPRPEQGRVVKIDAENIYQFAMIGMNQSQVAAYYGLKESDFRSAISDYPDIEDAFLMGKGRGTAVRLAALAKKVADGDTIAIIYSSKVFDDCVEADKRQNIKIDDSVKVQVYLPENGR
jgi:hypothetical protein